MQVDGEKRKRRSSTEARRKEYAKRRNVRFAKRLGFPETFMTIPK